MVWVIAWMTAGSVDILFLLSLSCSTFLPVVVGILAPGVRFKKTLWSEDMDDRGERALLSEARDVLDISLLCCSRTPHDGKPDGGTEFCAYAAALAADRKLLVDGGCRKFDWGGGMLEPCCLGPYAPPLPCTESIVPKVGVVARWMSSGGGGEDGRGGGPSDTEDVVAILRSGIKGGGAMVPDGGG